MVSRDKFLYSAKSLDLKSSERKKSVSASKLRQPACTNQSGSRRDSDRAVDPAIDPDAAWVASLQWAEAWYNSMIAHRFIYCYINL